MKKIISIVSIALLISSCTDQTDQISIAKNFQEKQNENFGNGKTSILPKDALKNFEGLPFYPISEKYIIEAILTPTPFEKPFKMKTTTDREPVFIKYGELVFNIDGINQKLDVFQDVNSRLEKGNENNLFLPFLDPTNGDTTYGGGRYIDLEIPKNGDKVILNLNTAYNPYCAYNPKYSCPIVPLQNKLSVPILAGIKI